MSRITFAQVNALPDILDQTAFELVLGNLPLAGQASDLTIKCQNVAMPGVSSEFWEAALHGHVKKFRGRKMYPRTVTAAFYEDSTFGTINKLRQWNEFIAGSESGNSQGFSGDYTIEAELLVYNTVGQVINRTVFENFAVQEIPDVQFDGSSSQGVSVSVTFTYDRIRSNGHPTL